LFVSFLSVTFLRPTEIICSSIPPVEKKWPKFVLRGKKHIPTEKFAEYLIQSARNF